MDYAVITKMIINILIMFSLTILVLSAEKSGLLSIVTRPLDKVTDNRVIMVMWFFISSVLSAFTVDTTLAMILIPIALVYATSRNLNKAELLIAITWANVVGSEWTYFGAGDTLISWTLLEKYLHRPLDMITWAKLFWTPTLLACIITLLWLWFMVLSKVKIKPLLRDKVVITPSNIITWLVVVVGIGSIFFNKLQWYTIGLAVASIFISGLNFKDLKKLPFKGVYIWTASIILGVVINQYASAHLHLIVPTYVYSLLGIVLIFAVISVIHLGITSSGLTAILLPLIMASQFTDKIWLYVLVTKAISLSYLTILSNGSLAVSASYGMSQKDIFRKGIPIVLLQSILFVAYFYFMEGRISL